MKQNIELKSINNPSAIEGIKHLEEMFNNAKKALVEGRPVIVISSVDIGDSYLNQDLFEEVNDDIRGNFFKYSIGILNRMQIN